MSKSAIDYSNIVITQIPEVPTPKRTLLSVVARRQEQRSGENPEFFPDQKSDQAYQEISHKNDFEAVSVEIVNRLKIRGISTSKDYVSAFLSIYSNQFQDHQDAKKAADDAKLKADFNQHIEKLDQKHAAVFIARIREHWSFGEIGKLLNISDGQADNLFKEAEHIFDSDSMQTELISHGIDLDISVADLITTLKAHANVIRSTKGRKPKNQKNNLAHPDKQGDIFGGDE